MPVFVSKFPYPLKTPIFNLWLKEWIIFILLAQTFKDGRRDKIINCDFHTFIIALESDLSFRRLMCKETSGDGSSAYGSKIQ